MDSKQCFDGGAIVHGPPHDGLIRVRKDNDPMDLAARSLQYAYDPHLGRQVVVSGCLAHLRDVVRLERSRRE